MRSPRELFLLALAFGTLFGAISRLAISQDGIIQIQGPPHEIRQPKFVSAGEAGFLCEAGKLKVKKPERLALELAFRFAWVEFHPDIESYFPK